MAQWRAQAALEAGGKELSESDKLVLERYGVFRRSTMPGSSPKQQFDAAVQLIRGLPKDGLFQPSNDMKLRLYGFFKQATEGPCMQPAPSFWDVIGKAKWGAWKNLGDMPAEQAMTSYVDEIKQVLETMSLTEDVANLMDALGPVYEYVEEDAAGGRPARKKHVHFSAEEEAAAAPTTNGHSHPADGEEQDEDGEEQERRTDARSLQEETAVVQNGVSSAPAAGGAGAAAPQPQRTERWTGSATSDTDDDEEFNDPIGETELSSGRGLSTEARLDALNHQLTALARLIDSAGSQMQLSTGGMTLTNGVRSAAAGGATTAAVAVTGAPPAPSGANATCPGVHDELRALVRDMRDDLDTVTGRLRRLEVAHSAAPAEKCAVRPWWQVPELSPGSVLVLLAWPLVLQLVLRLITSRRSRR